MNKALMMNAGYRLHGRKASSVMPTVRMSQLLFSWPQLPLEEIPCPGRQTRAPRINHVYY